MEGKILLPGSVDVREVGLREGCQSQARVMSTETKVAIINKLLDAGLRKMDVVSFVSPKVMPQMADAEELLRKIPHRTDVEYVAICLNRQSVERAIDARKNFGRPSKLGFVTVTTQSTLRTSGIRKPLEEHIRDVGEYVKSAKAVGFQTLVFVSCAFGCSIEGQVNEAIVVDLVDRNLKFGADEIVISDSTGQASPVQIHRLFSLLDKEFGDIPITAHFHDSRGAGLANVFALLEVGLKRLTIDSAIGGLGGEPWLPQVAGNIATEDLISMLDGMGVHTGVDLTKVIECSRMFEDVYGNICTSHTLRVGPVKWRYS